MYLKFQSSHAFAKGGLMRPVNAVYKGRQFMSNFGSKKIRFVKQATEPCCRTAYRHKENLKITKRIGPCQPAQTAQVDMSQGFSQMH